MVSRLSHQPRHAGQGQQFAVNVYYDAPLSAAPDAPNVSFYAAALYLDYGPGYIRNNAPMNPATGTSNAANNTIGGFGNLFPQFSTGNVIYTQMGYKLKNNLLGSSIFIPYFSYQYSRYACLSNDVNYYNMGIHWLLAGHTSKFTLTYQNRPYYIARASDGLNVVDSRRSAVVLQHQVYFN